MHYIPQQYHDNIRNYSYKGGTSSITYSLIWSPLAEKVTLLFPKSVAPNSITIFALLMLIIYHPIFMYYNDDGGEIPSWKLYVMGATILIYQTLDNVDGKQARRTKSSSPLGMILDHGSDCITTFIIGLQFARILRLGAEKSMIIVFALLFMLTFVAIWSQYCTGNFRLGRLNAVDEGLPTYAAICFFLGMTGTAKLNEFHIFANYNQQIVYTLLALSPLQFFSLTKNIFSEKLKSATQMLQIWIIPLVIGGSLYLIYFVNPNVYKQAFNPICYVLLFVTANNMIMIQICYVAKMRHQVFTNSLMLFMTGIGLYCLLLKFWFVNTFYYFIGFAILQGILFLEFEISCFSLIAKVLGIKVFSIKPSKQA